MPERIFVDVNTDIDRTGYLSPRSITWKDGRVFRIEDVRAFRPAGDSRLDCYTVVIRGKERRLFFERSGEHFSCRFGRWYVES